MTGVERMFDGEKLATPSGVAAVLQAYGLAARKSLGQNFLIDRNVLERIVASAALHPGDVVLEVGPGLGVLTWQLAKGCQNVIAVELDEGFVHWLQTLFARNTLRADVQIVHGDALQVDLDVLLADKPPKPGGGYKLVANLPYYITSPLLVRFLELSSPLTSLVVMMQKEVAARLGAAPGTKEYGALSVAVQLRADIETIMVVSPGSFYPAPAVESAVVRLTPRRLTKAVDDEQVLRDVVRAAFGQRRKTVRNALKQLTTAVDDVLHRARVDGKRRGETLTPGEFVRIANALIPSLHVEEQRPK